MPLPRVQPIIPVSSKPPFDDPDWLFEFKYDGFRALCYIEQGSCRFISRRGNIMSRFDALGTEMAAELELDDVILDGICRPDAIFGMYFAINLGSFSMFPP